MKPDQPTEETRCSACGSKNVYVETTCPGPSLRFPGAYLSGGTTVFCGDCRHTQTWSWPAKTPTRRGAGTRP